MCGRTANALPRDRLTRACGGRDGNGRRRVAQWREAPDGQQYQPSYNAAPGSHQPVLRMARPLPDDVGTESDVEVPPEQETRLLQPMCWGLVAPWTKQCDVKSAGYKTNNARSESMLEKPTFKQPLAKGHRCAVPVEGYYEWHTVDGKKQPYFIYNPPTSDEQNGEDKQNENSENEMNENCEKDIKKQEPAVGEAAGRGVLFLAAIFDVWRGPGGTQLYSYSIITVDAHESVAWIHHRMPAVLHTEEELDSWLRAGEVPLEQAVSVIRPTAGLRAYPVSTVVNKTHEQGDVCLKRVDPKKVQETPSSRLMSAWLTKAPKRKPDNEDEQDSKKRVKQTRLGDN